MKSNLTRPITRPVTRKVTRGVTDLGYGGGDLSFAQALSMLAPYSPRLALDFESATNSLWTDTGRTTQLTTLGTGIAGATNRVTGAAVHAAQASAPKRPTWGRYPAGGTRNLLLHTEDFNNAAWTRVNVLITANQTASPIGDLTADLVTETGAVPRIRQVANISTGNYVFSVYLKAGTQSIVGFGGQALGELASVEFNLSTGVVSGAPTGTAYVSRAIQSVGNGWYRCSVVLDAAGWTSGNGLGIRHSGSAGTFYLWGAQLELGSSATPYQRVTNAFDVTESGVKDVYGARFDGIDDCLQVTGFDLSDTDKVTVIAVVRWLGNIASAGVLIEHTADFNTNTGSFYLVAGTDSQVGWNSKSRGSAADVGITLKAYKTFSESPRTAIVSVTHDISGDLSRLFEDNVIGVDGTGDKGAGNFLNSTLFIGQRNAATVPFDGVITQLFVLGAIVPDAVLEKVSIGGAKKQGRTI